MSGHSKWSTIKRDKEKTDQARGKIFTKIGKEIAVAVKAGGPDPANNPKLATVIAKARANNMPNDNIQRSIKKASGEGSAVNYESMMYEGYGPGGSAIICDILTDNKNRASSDVRHIFDRAGGALGGPGSVAFMFDRKAVIATKAKSNLTEDDVMMTAIDAGADDFNVTDEGYEIYTSPENFLKVKEALEGIGVTEFLTSEVTFVSNMKTSVSEEDSEKVYGLIEALEEIDDVQDVYTNLDE